MYDLILLPTDGSEYAEAAAETGIELAEIHGAAVHVVCVADPGPLGDLRLPGDAADPGEVLRDRAREYVERIAERARGRGLEVTTSVRTGPPGSGILDCVDEEGADLVVMGTRGRGGIRRAVLGSVTDHVIRFGDVQVLTAGESRPE